MSNMSNPFKEENERQARNAIIQGASNPNLPADTDAVERPIFIGEERDPEKAKEILESASVDNSIATTFHGNLGSVLGGEGVGKSRLNHDGYIMTAKNDNGLRVHNKLTDPSTTQEEIQHFVDMMNERNDNFTRNRKFTTEINTNEKLIELTARKNDDGFTDYMIEWADSTFFRQFPINRLTELSSGTIDRMYLLYQKLAKLKELRLAQEEREAHPDYLEPSKGGCWFCHKKNTDAFDTEFDTNLHIQCLKDTLEKEPEHPEARFMKYLLNLN